MTSRTDHVSGNPQSLQEPSIASPATSDEHTRGTKRSHSDTRSTPIICDICGKLYSRLDHLSRHYRSHTQEKPFTCDTCQKSFSRPDLLKRHCQSHETTNPDGSKRLKEGQPTASRATQACASCAASKVRCEGGHPCNRCQKRNAVCVYNGRNLTSATMIPSNMEGEGPGSRRASLRKIEVNSNTAGLPKVNDANGMIARSALDEQLLVLNQKNARSGDFHSNVVGAEGFDEVGLAGFLWDIMEPSPSDADNPSPQSYYPPIDLLDFAASNPFQLQREPPDEVVDALTMTAGRAPVQSTDTLRRNETAFLSQGLSIGVKAFKESLWNYNPMQENRQSDQRTYVFMPLEDMVSLTRVGTYGSRCADLTAATRDQILATILHHSDQRLVSNIMRVFPSAELLSNLVLQFFCWHNDREDGFIHTPTFDTNQQSPELLISILATSAMRSNIPQIRKLGAAFLEIAWSSNLRLMEADDRNARCLRPQQAFFLSLDVGLWSGIKRQVELAEAYGLSLITMLRRGGSFRPPAHQAPMPTEHDSVSELGVKWRYWAEEESRRRLVFRVFLRDAHQSASFVTPPLLSPACIALHLPASRDLWDAESAEAWRNIYLSKHASVNNSVPSFRSLMLEDAKIESLLHVIDVNFTILLVLAGIWDFAASYREIRWHRCQRATSGSDAVVSNLYEEIILSMEQRREEMSCWIEIVPFTAQIFQERIMLSMYVSFEDLQHLAGKTGEDEAARVFPTLRTWSDSRDARHALWHAGQIFRAAKQYPPFRLQYFAAVALYHASLVFWAYAITENAQGFSGHHSVRSGTSIEQREVIHLDGGENEAKDEYLALGHGTPVLTIISLSGDRAFPQIISATDATAVMTGMIDLLRQNNGGSDTTCAPLITNLSTLMRALGNAASGIMSYKERAG